MGQFIIIGYCIQVLVIKMPQLIILLFIGSSMLSITMLIVLRMCSYRELIDAGYSDRYLRMQCEMGQERYMYCNDTALNVYEAHVYKGIVDQ